MVYFGEERMAFGVVYKLKYFIFIAKKHGKWEEHRENTGNLVLIRVWQPCLFFRCEGMVTMLATQLLFRNLFTADLSYFLPFQPHSRGCFERTLKRV